MKLNRVISSSHTEDITVRGRDILNHIKEVVLKKTADTV